MTEEKDPKAASLLGRPPAPQEGKSPRSVPPPPPASKGPVAWARDRLRPAVRQPPPPRDKQSSAEEISTSSFLEEFKDPVEISESMLVEDISSDADGPRKSAPPRPPPARGSGGTMRPGAMGKTPAISAAQPPVSAPVPSSVRLQPMETRSFELPHVARGPAEVGSPEPATQTVEIPEPAPTAKSLPLESPRSTSVSSSDHEPLPVVQEDATALGAPTNPSAEQAQGPFEAPFGQDEPPPAVPMVSTVGALRAAGSKFRDTLRPAAHAIGGAVPRIRESLRPLAEAVRTAAPAIRDSIRDGARTGRGPAFLTVVGAGGLTIGILLALVIGIALHKPKADDTSAPGASASSEPIAAGPSQSAPTTVATAPSKAPEAASASPAIACSLAGVSRVVAPSAVIGPGIEASVLGNDIAIGYAASENKGAAVRLDPASLSANGIAAVGISRHVIRRVTPVPVRSGVGVVVDADRHGDALDSRRTVVSDPLLQLGNADGALAFARVAGGKPVGKLWNVGVQDPVDAFRAAAGSHSLSIVFREGGQRVGLGLTDYGAVLTPEGVVSYFDGLGPAVGSPVVASGDGGDLVVWADRASADVPWGLRMVHVKADVIDDNPLKPVPFTPPGLSAGDQVMSPSVVALPRKRFFLAWTQGPATDHRVRAVTLSENGEPIGAPIDISDPNVNSGEARVAVAPSGRGVVAFLQSSGKTFEVVATAVSCAM